MTYRELVDKDTQSGAHVRPEHFRQCSEGDGLIKGRLELVEQLGEYALVHLIADSSLEFVAKMERPPSARQGEQMSFTAEEGSIHIFDRDSGVRIA